MDVKLGMDDDIPATTALKISNSIIFRLFHPKTLTRENTFACGDFNKPTLYYC